jgi:hypothetical protein
MPWSDLPDPFPQMTPTERVQAVLARLGCIGITGIILAGVIVGSTMLL